MSDILEYERNKDKKKKHFLKQTLKKKEQGWLDQQENALYYRKVFQL